jgi:ribosomal protein L11 methyltransferase PrmA
MDLKRLLYSTSPLLYRLAEVLYEQTPTFRRRQARALAQMSSRISARIEGEAKIFADHFGGNLDVRTGPFKGMAYMLASCGSVLGPKVIGSYESQVQGWIEDAIARRYEKIIDIGCAEGYYAVGFALRCPAARVYAFDTDRNALDQLRLLARKNHVEDRIEVGELCTYSDLARLCTPSTLVFCDIEGAERVLLRIDRVPALRTTDMIVEAHDSLSPGLTPELVRRFVSTHKIEIAYHEKKSPRAYPFLQSLREEDAQALMDEARATDQAWIRLRAYA